MGRHHSRNTTVQFLDASGAFSITVGPGEGDFAWDPTNHGNTEKVRNMDRGKFDGCHIETIDLEQAISITTQMRNETLTEAVLPRLQDFLLKTGSYAAAVSVNGNPDIWSWRAKITMTTGGVTTEYELPFVTADFGFSEGVEAHTVAITGTNNGPILRDGVAVPVTP